MKHILILFLFTLSLSANAQLTSVVSESHQPLSAVQKDSLIALLMRNNSQDYFVVPNIPAKKIAKARTYCEIDSTEEIYALIDLTVSGKANNCLLICNTGIYIHNGGSSTHPGRYFISYSQLRSAFISHGDYLEVNIGPTSADISGSGVKEIFLIALLEQIKFIVSG